MQDYIENSYVLCICEGASERAIVEILLENDKLIFNRENLLENEVKRERSASVIQTNYLNRTFSKSLYIVRILDSKKEQFKISRSYLRKIKKTYNVYTMPEIEMLIIISEGHYNKYKQGRYQKLKPSQYCIQVLKLKEVKSYDFIKGYFSDINKLLEVLKKYDESKAGKELSIYRLIK